MPEITSAIIKLLSPMPTELPTASQFMRAGAPVRWIVAHYITRESWTGSTLLEVPSWMKILLWDNQAG